MNSLYNSPSEQIRMDTESVDEIFIDLATACIYQDPSPLKPIIALEERIELSSDRFFITTE